MGREGRGKSLHFTKYFLPSLCVFSFSFSLSPAPFLPPSLLDPFGSIYGRFKCFYAAPPASPVHREVSQLGELNTEAQRSELDSLLH